MSQHACERARAQRVAALYEDIMDRVMRELRMSLRRDGHMFEDEAVLLDLKRLWHEKLVARGAFAAAVEGSGVVRTIGSGRSIVAAQYALPEAVAAERGNLQRPRGQRPSDAMQIVPIAPLATRTMHEMGSGLPRGADLYAPVHDGEPDLQMEDPGPRRPFTSGTVMSIPQNRKRSMAMVER